MNKRLLSHVQATFVCIIVGLSLVIFSLFGYFHPPHRLLPIILWLALVFLVRHHNVLRCSLFIGALVYFELAAEVGSFRIITILFLLSFAYAFYHSVRAWILSQVAREKCIAQEK